jgi:hypothetical protein
MSHVNAMGRVARALCSILFLASFTGAAEHEAKDVDPDREALRKSTAAVVSYGRKAVAAKDMALNALKNAFAVRHDAEFEWMNALKAGKKDTISSAAGALEKAVKEAVKAGRTAEAVVKHAMEASSAATAARYTERTASDPETGYDLRKARKEVDKLAGVAEKAADKAEALAENLKEKWLIPVETGPDAEK